MSLIAIRAPSAWPPSGRGAQDLVLARSERCAHAVFELRRGRSVARKPIAPKLNEKNGRAAAYRRSVDRIVPSPPRTTARSVSLRRRSAPSSSPGIRLEAVLRHLVLRNAHLHAGLARELDHPLQRVAGHLRALVGEDGDGGFTDGSALSAAASRSSTAPARPGSAIQTNVSRFPAGPGSPEGAKPITDAPARSRAKPATATSAARRSPASAPRRPSPPARGRPRTAASPSQAGRSAARRRATTAGSTLVSEMKERSATIRSGSVRQLARLDLSGRCARSIDDHAVVVPQPPVELAVGDVERDHRFRPALQEARP